MLQYRIRARERDPAPPHQTRSSPVPAPFRALLFFFQVLKTLETSEDVDIENNLVLLLDVDKFALVKVLLKNRSKIIWCTRLARAQDEAEVARIEAEMEGSPETAKILKELNATRASARERQNAMERRCGLPAMSRRQVSRGWFAGG